VDCRDIKRLNSLRENLVLISMYILPLRFRLEMLRHTGIKNDWRPRSVSNRFLLLLLLRSRSIAEKRLVEHLNGFDISVMERPSELTA
jgi:hypothetical protein